ncbi:DUF190 domain-containing protein [Acidiphilium sp.]|uniref:DUF190 domain-containing protein n=1 Tax=Acidiphilium sp. TaxID=527 RepID=UPI003D00916A
MKQSATMIRIAIHESDHSRRRSLMDEVLNILKSQHITGVSVLRGIAGLSARGVIHAADMIHFDVDLPLAIEFYTSPDEAEIAIAALLPIVPRGHVVSWDVTMYE